MADYTIQKGDTLSKIAKANNTTVEALAAANGIKNVNLIRSGAKLSIPSAGTVDGVTLGDPADGVSLEAGAVADAAGGAAAAKAAQNSAFRDQLVSFLGQASAPYSAGSGFSQAANNYNAQMAGIKTQYGQMAEQQKAAAAAAAEQNRRQAYVNGRLSANRNNEQVAALGLGGNLYADPMSGYSETSRIAADNNMRTNINQVTLAEQDAINKIALQLMEQNANLDMQTAQYLGSLELARIQAEQQAAQNALSMQLSALGMLNNYDQQQYENDLAEREFAFKQQQYADELALAQQKLKKSSSGGGSGGSSMTAKQIAQAVINSTVNSNMSQGEAGNAVLNAITTVLPAYATSAKSADVLQEAEDTLYNFAYETYMNHMRQTHPDYYSSR